MDNQMIKNRNNRVLLIYTGGTIGMGQNPETGALEPLDFNHLVSCMPEFSMLNTGIETYQFTQPIDSSDMSPRSTFHICGSSSSEVRRRNRPVLVMY